MNDLLVKRRTTAYRCEPPTSPDDDDIYTYAINFPVNLMPGSYPIATMDTDPHGNVWYVKDGPIFYAVHDDQLNDGGSDHYGR